MNVTQLSREVGVSVETIRRDLAVLERQGLIRREYGTAFPIESVAFETDLDRGSQTLLPEKQRIATHAATQLNDAESIFIDEGLLPSLIARNIPLERRLTVVTASLPVAVDLAPRLNCTVIMLGGRVRGKTLGTVDKWVVDMIAEFSIDLAFVGANGLSIAHGATTPDPAVSAVKAAAMHASRRRVFVGAHNKFGTATFSKFAEVRDFDLLITDTGLPRRVALDYAAAGAEVCRV